jgi:hypothetical protein
MKGGHDGGILETSKLGKSPVPLEKKSSFLNSKNLLMSEENVNPVGSAKDVGLSSSSPCSQIFSQIPLIPQVLEK